MSYKNLSVCIVCMLFSSFAFAEEIKRPSLKTVDALKNTRLFHNGNEFTVEQNGRTIPVQSCFVSTELRKITSATLLKALAAETGNYLKLSELKKEDNSTDYKLELRKGGLNGGGPILGAVTALGGCLVTAAAAAGAAVLAVPTGPVGMTAAVVATTKAGMAATVYATIVATGTPTA